MTELDQNLNRNNQPDKTFPSVNEERRQIVPNTIIEAIKPRSADELDRAGFNLEAINRTAPDANKPKEIFLNPPLSLKAQLKELKRRERSYIIGDYINPELERLRAEIRFVASKIQTPPEENPRT